MLLLNWAGPLGHWEPCDRLRLLRLLRPLKFWPLETEKTGRLRASVMHHGIPDSLKTEASCPARILVGVDLTLRP